MCVFYHHAFKTCLDDCSDKVEDCMTLKADMERETKLDFIKNGLYIFECLAG